MTTVSTMRDRGETLVEIVLAVVVISIAVGALVTGLATAANAAGAQRESVVADTTLRNLVEGAKSAAGSCTPGGRLTVDAPVPDGWTAAFEPATLPCPTGGDTLALRVQVTSPADHTWSLETIVRAP
jgi:type II secretory pathway pseudopilin PulG